MPNLFDGIFENTTTETIEFSAFLLCMLSSLVVGLVLAWMYMYRTRYTKSFITALAILPSVVCVVIMMVNGNIGTGVAVAGVFGLVRFRSAPGTAKEISAIFLAMGAGLLAGMGYIGYAFLFTVVVGAAKMIYEHIDFGAKRNGQKYLTLQVTIPEDLDYHQALDEIMNEYTTSWEMTQVKTTNMGSMFRLSYAIVLKEVNQEKEFIDYLRTRNGNLEIVVSQQANVNNEL